MSKRMWRWWWWWSVGVPLLVWGCVWVDAIVGMGVHSPPRNDDVNMIVVVVVNMIVVVVDDACHEHGHHKQDREWHHDTNGTVQLAGVDIDVLHWHAALHHTLPHCHYQ